MTKEEFISFIAEQEKITKVEAEKIINIFTKSITNALNQKQEINLIGFGSFYISKVNERQGRNPRTGDALIIPAYNQPKFSAGKKLKDACNT